MFRYIWYVTSYSRIKMCISQIILTLIVTFTDERITIPATEKALCSFTPDILRYLLASQIDGADNENSIQMQPYSSSFNGVCLIADISGFTRLSGTYLTPALSSIVFIVVIIIIFVIMIISIIIISIILTM